MLAQDDFLGSWQVARSIDDRLTHQVGAFHGTARFVTLGSGLDYSEIGKMRLGTGPQMQAERRYLWQWAHSDIEVCFADGAAFHRFVPAGKAAGTTHLCGEDLYDVTYDFTHWPTWEAVWRVKGPRKDYVSASVYTRA